MPNETSYLALGLMSGTSADGIDAALIRTDGENAIETIGGLTVPYEAEFQQQLIALASSNLTLDEVRTASKDIERKLTKLHVDAVQRWFDTYEKSSVDDLDVIGFHGHTLRHDPANGITWQLGDGPLLARETGCKVVYDFRQADVAAGGEGAPLAPLYHRALVADREQPQLVINIGGVANITWIGEDEVIAGDTGPGCGLLDAHAQRILNRAYDEDGKLALDGRIDESFVEKTLDALAYFRRSLPKSADRYEFDSIDVAHLSDADAAATLCAITADAISRAVDDSEKQRPKETWVTGGGQHHPLIMSRLSERLPNVRRMSECCNDDGLLEAQCFAWLAVRRLLALPTSLPSTTGASHAVCGGEVAPK